MKQTILILMAFTISFGVIAQKKNKAQHPTKSNQVAQVNVNHSTKTGKATLKAPHQVYTAFTSEYPNASNVVWTKSRGNWTSAYTLNGYRTVATYHANGKRMDTRTYYPVASPPQPVMVYQQSAPSIRLGRIIQIDLPGSTPVYQLRTTTGKLLYVNNAGTVVTYQP